MKTENGVARKKRWKHSFIVLLLFFSFHAVAQAQHISEGDGGGDKGGGGNLMLAPPQPATMLEILDSLSDVRLELYMFLNSICNPDGQANSCAASSEAEVNDALQKMIPKIYSIGLTVMTDEPCYDALHHPKVGSIYGKIENGIQNICVSGKTLFKSKQTAEEIHAQIVSLVAHEYAHTAGFVTQVIPEKVQYLLRERFKLIPRNFLGDTIGKFNSRYINIATKFGSIYKNQLKLGNGRMARTVSEMNEQIQQIFGDLYESLPQLYSVVGNHDKLNLLSTMVRTNILSITADAAEGDATNQDRLEYQHLFNNLSEIGLAPGLPIQYLRLPEYDGIFYTPEAKSCSLKKINTTEQETEDLGLILSSVTNLHSWVMKTRSHFTSKEIERQIFDCYHAQGDLHAPSTK